MPANRIYKPNKLLDGEYYRNVGAFIW